MVPTIHIEDGYRFFFSNEGDEPPHAHVERGDGLARFWLAPVFLAGASGLKAQELARARQIVEERRELRGAME